MRRIFFLAPAVGILLGLALPALAEDSSASSSRSEEASTRIERLLQRLETISESIEENFGTDVESASADGASPAGSLSRVEAMLRRVDALVITISLDGLPPSPPPLEGLSPVARIEAAIERIDALVSSISAETGATPATGGFSPLARIDNAIRRVDALVETISAIATTGTTSPSDTEGPAATESDSRVAGASEAADVRVSPFSRWDRAKKTLTTIFRAYTEKDAGRFISQFSEDAQQVISVFQNAILEDFRRETDILVDIELLEYRHTETTTQTRFRWNRSATVVATGTTRVDAGIATFWLKRDSDYKVTQVEGRMPFGLNDPEVQKQARTGQVNAPAALDALGNPIPPTAATPTTPAPAPPPGPPPLPTTNLAILLDISPGGGGNLAAIDLDNPGAVRRVVTQVPGGENPAPGEDVHIFVDLNVPGGPITVRDVGGNGVVACGSSGSLNTLRDVVPGALVAFGAPNNTTGDRFGVQTAAGKYVLLQVPSLAQAVVLVGGVNPIVNALGTVSCP